MNRLMQTIVLALFPLWAMGQAGGTMLFPEKREGIVYFKNGSPGWVMANYDASERAMHYDKDDVDMVLTNTENIDSIVVEGRKFLPLADAFVESMTVGSHVLLVDWRIEMLDVGYRNAYGQVTHQARVKTGKTSMIRSGSVGNDDSTDADPSVVKQKNLSTYYLLVDGKRRKFYNAKTFLKLFPSRTAEVEEKINSLHVRFDNLEQIKALLLAIP